MPTRYADALAEAGIGKTCAANMQAADAFGTVTSCKELLWWS